MNKLQQPTTLGQKAQFVTNLIVNHSLSIPSGTNLFGVAMRVEYGEVEGLELRCYRSVDSVLPPTLLSTCYIAGICIDSGFRVHVEWLHPDIRLSVGATGDSGQRDKDILLMSKNYIDKKMMYDNIKKELRSAENDLISVGIDPKQLRSR